MASGSRRCTRVIEAFASCVSIAITVWAFFDAVARHFAIDGRVPFAERAEIWEELHARAALSMQNNSGHPDGRTYARDSQDAKDVMNWVSDRLRNEIGSIYKIVPDS